MDAMVRRGWFVSAGVLNEGDSDFETARALGLRTVGAPPFTPISQAQHKANLKLIASAQATILAPVHFGPGNLLNLSAVQEALRVGPVLLFNDPPISSRDHTRGRASQMFWEMADSGAILVSECEEATKALSSMLGKEATPCEKPV